VKWIAVPATALSCISAGLAWTGAGWLLPHLGLEEFGLLVRSGAVFIVLGLVERLLSALPHANQGDSR